MRIIDIPEFKDRKQALMLEKETSLLDAVAKMKILNYGAIIVTENGKLCGIFTERDLLTKVVAEGKEVNSLKLADVMTSNVKTAHLTDSIYNSMRRMTQGHFRHLPIIDDSGQIIGMISQDDIVAVTWYQLFEQFKIKNKPSFMSFTQLWVFVLAIAVYFTAMFLFFIR